MLPFSVNFVFALSMSISKEKNSCLGWQGETVGSDKPFGVNSVDVRDFLDPFPPMIDWRFFALKK